MRQNRVGFGGGKKSMHARMIAFYIMGLSMKTLKNALFVDSVDSIIEKMVVMMRTTMFWYSQKKRRA
jgi:hypothetical protein